VSAAATRVRRAAPLLPWAGAVVAFATVVVGTILDANGTRLGVPNPPFIGAYGPKANTWLIAAIPCFVVAVALVPRLLRSRPAVFAAGLFVVTLVLRLVLAAARQGPYAWHRAFDVLPRGEGKNEYLPALPAFDYGPRFVLDRFAELVPALPVHAAGHPPGLLLTMYLLQLDTARKLAWFCIIVGALSAPLAYALGRQIFEERAARITGLLMAFSPAALHFGATSADAVYLTAGLIAAVLLFQRQWLGAIALAVASLFAWSLLAVGAWAAILTLVRDGLKPAIKLSLIIGAASIAFQALLALATGWDPIGTLKATSHVYEVGIASRRPYAYWLFGSPTAFLLILGAPIAWLATAQLAKRSPEAVAIFAVIAISAVLGFTKAETERIWLFLVPFVCLAAAPRITRPTPLIAFLATQALVYELVFDTLW
jgi:methylthioxylose transferase